MLITVLLAIVLLLMRLKQRRVHCNAPGPRRHDKRLRPPASPIVAVRRVTVSSHAHNVETAGCAHERCAPPPRYYGAGVGAAVVDVVSARVHMLAERALERAHAPRVQIQLYLLVGCAHQPQPLLPERLSSHFSVSSAVCSTSTNTVADAVTDAFSVVVAPVATTVAFVVNVIIDCNVCVVFV